MTIELLAVDADQEHQKALKELIRSVLGYEVHCLDSLDVSEFDERDYKALLIEPYKKGEPLNFNNPAVGFIYGARERGIPVFITTGHPEAELFSAYGLVRDRDYQEHFEKPFWIKDELCPVLKRVVENNNS